MRALRGFKVISDFESKHCQGEDTGGDRILLPCPRVEVRLPDDKRAVAFQHMKLQPAPDYDKSNQQVSAVTDEIERTTGEKG